MKKIIGVILFLAVTGGIWYGVSSWRRNSILDSGRVVLLTDKDKGFYTYSDLMPRDEITRSYVIVGYADELSPEAVSQATKGLFLKIDAETTPGDPRVIASLTASAPVPEDEAEQTAWSSAVALLSQPQRDLCGQIEDTSVQQYCLARHIVYNGLKARASTEACAPLFVETQREECRADLESADPNRLADQDQDGLVDLFEAYAQPYSERVNDRNLPEIIF